MHMQVCPGRLVRRLFRDVLEVAPIPKPVLLVDDDVMIRTAVATFLASAGYTVVPVSDGDEALARAARGGTSVSSPSSGSGPPGGRWSAWCSGRMHVAVPGRPLAEEPGDPMGELAAAAEPEAARPEAVAGATPDPAGVRLPAPRPAPAPETHRRVRVGGEVFQREGEGPLGHRRPLH